MPSSNSARATAIQTATEYLAAVDPILAGIVARVGPCTLVPDPRPFRTLVSSIISQQVSGRAADTILRRVLDGSDATMGAHEDVSPRHILELGADRLRAAGCSQAKTAYLTSLAEHVTSGKIDLAHVVTLDDEQVKARLVELRGIGPWTADMFLIFCLGRLDVWPVDDLGIRAALRAFYDLPDLPRRSEALLMGEPWRPYRSIATWYLWAGLEAEKPVLAGQPREAIATVQRANRRQQRDLTVGE